MERVVLRRSFKVVTEVKTVHRVQRSILVKKKEVIPEYNTTRGVRPDYVPGPVKIYTREEIAAYLKSRGK